MLQIENKIVSLDILENHFVCHLAKCKGYCCVKGASGAPLEAGEAELLKDLFPHIKSFLSPEGSSAIEKQGIPVIDPDGDEVTPLIDGKECAFAIFENGIAQCGIEKAYHAGKIPFRKPVSCHLYPVRVKKLSETYALIYDQWDLCDPARILGDEKKVKIYEFVKPALVRKFGDSFYSELIRVDQEMDRDKFSRWEWDINSEP